MNLVRDQPTTGANAAHEQRLIRWAHLKPFVFVPTKHAPAAAAAASSFAAASAGLGGTLVAVHPVACFANSTLEHAFGVDWERLVKDFAKPWPLPSALATLTFSSSECHELCLKLHACVIL
jgi:hypothetical protein